ncbi:hypothetical protein GCM10010038_29220 [Glutamicibacter protophormiae]|nr:hypothetical protein GCM10010038_29220 [Glutamicibacter protophormiae]
MYGAASDCFITWVHKITEGAACRTPQVPTGPARAGGRRPNPAPAPEHGIERVADKAFSKPAGN